MSLPEAEIVLVAARLRYLGQLVTGGQPVLWALLQRDAAWQDQTHKDFEKLSYYCPEYGPFWPVQQHWDDFSQYVKESPMRWKRIMRKFLARAISVQKIDTEWAAWHQEIRDQLIQNELVSPEPPRAFDQTFCCLVCRRFFDKKAFMAVHAFKKHGRANRARAFVSGQQCESCLRHYELPSDLINHVKRSDVCFLFYQQRGHRVEREPAVNSRSEKKQKSLMRMPFMQAAGPKCSFPQQPEDEFLEERGLQQQWSEVLLTHLPPLDLLEGLRQATLSTFLFLE